MIQLLILLMSASVFADDKPAPPPPSLKENMKSIADNVKQITLDSRDAKKNELNLKRALALLDLFKAIEVQVPDTIAELGEPQKTTALADYKRLVDAEIEQTSKLISGLKANDNSQVLNILKAMGQIKMEGHEKYKKQDQ